MNLKLKVWRQQNSNSKGKMVTYNISDISPDMSFLEMMDVLNNELDLARKEIELISVDTQLISASYTIRSITSGLIPKIIKPPLK